MAAYSAVERAPLASLFQDAKDLDRLTCPICSEVMETAFMPSCQHTACWTCWQRMEQTVCPFCRELFHECDLVVCRHLVCCLAESHVRCPYSCGWTGRICVVKWGGVFLYLFLIKQSSKLNYISGAGPNAEFV